MEVLLQVSYWNIIITIEQICLTDTHSMIDSSATLDQVASQLHMVVDDRL